ncbi:MAG TPA: hypothetical protein EYQ32_08670 [Gammaproteobacteria bacterium]|nr:hypothetical protein [Gammaproteobacteria bacterium]
MLRHLIGASKRHAMHHLREVSSLTGAVPVILTVSFKVAGPQVPTTAMESLDAEVLKLCKQKDCLSAIDSALARPTLYGHG